jgi:hypothetical protein
MLQRFAWNAVEHRKEAVLVPETIQVTEPFSPTFKTVQEILRTDDRAITDTVKNMVMYAGNASVPLYKNPTIEFDTQIAKIPYGEMVMMTEVKGRFCKVAWREAEGWVLRDDLVFLNLTYRRESMFYIVYGSVT